MISGDFVISSEHSKAIDEELAFVHAHPDQMTRAEVDHFKQLAEHVYLLTPDNWLLRLPRVPELQPELESQGLAHVQFVGKLNLPGDWDAGRAGTCFRRLRYATLVRRYGRPAQIGHTS